MFEAAFRVPSISAKENPRCYFTFEKSVHYTYAGTFWPSFADGHSYGADNWRYVLSCFGQWIVAVKDELDVPDLWDSSFIKAASAMGGEDGDGEFTEAEKREVKKALKTLHSKVTSLPGFGAERAAKLEERLDYLEKKLDEHFSKIDWKNIFVGTVFHIYIAPWLEPFAGPFKDAVAQTVAPAAGSLFRGIFGLLTGK